MNLAMLITESERARLLRQIILDIVIDTINQRTGGGTKYINQRDEDFLLSAEISIEPLTLSPVEAERRSRFLQSSGTPNTQLPLYRWG